jgi:hypothetical protein
MSTAHVAKFAEVVAKDPALLARLGLEQVSDEASARICVSKAVKEAKAVGLEFTEEEGYEWMYVEESRSEVLTDSQLEAVAGGGKGISLSDQRSYQRANRPKGQWNDGKW